MFAAFQPLLSRLFVLVSGGAVLLSLAACNGTKAPGEDAPKRALDPRSEALRYFPASTEAVALVETSDEEALSAIDETLDGVSGWTRMRGRAGDSLRRAGIDPETILELSRRPATEIELPRPEIAFGTVPGSGSADDRALIVLPTEQGVELDRIFKEAAERGGLDAAGTFDDARLYRGPDLDFAVRDGVLIAANDLNRLQQALARRDGDRSDQFDDAPVTALLNQLPELATLRAYTRAGPATDALAELIGNAILERLEAGSPRGLPDPENRPDAKEAALTLRDEAGQLNIDVIVKLAEAAQLTEATEEEAEAGNDREPLPVAISAQALAATLAKLPADAPLRQVQQLAPLSGAAWIDGDTMRARFITSQ